MQITIERKSLQRVLTNVAGIVEQRSTVPILEHMRLEAVAGGLIVSATDLQTQVVERVDARVDQPGGCTVPAHTLAAIVRCLPDGTEISIADAPRERIVIRGGPTTYTLPSLSDPAYPRLTSTAPTATFTLAAPELAWMLDKTLFAAASSDPRVALNGVYMHVPTDVPEPVLRMVALDGHRLAKADLALPEGAGGMPAVILPRKGAQTLRRLLAGAEAAAELAVAERMLTVTIGDLSVTMCQLDAVYPDYARIVPSDNDNRVTVDVAAFAAAADRVASVASARVPSIRIEVRDGKCTISAKSERGDAAEETIAAEHDAPITFGVNQRYLRDLAGAIDGETVVLRLRTPGMAMLVDDPDEAATLQLLMPMRL